MNYGDPIILRGEKDKGRVLARLDEISVDEDHPIKVIIQEYSSDRTLAQNNLYWMWIDRLIKHVHRSTGELYDRESMSEVMKARLYPQIETNKELIKTYRRKLKVRLVSDDDEVIAKKDGISLVWRTFTVYLSTSKLGVKLMSDYMNIFDMDCHMNLGCELPHPEDMYNEAMGRKKSA